MEKKSDKPRALAPKIREDAAVWYEEFFPTLNAGATFALETFPHLYRVTLAEMRGRFSQGELSMILDVLNGHGSVLAYMSSGGGLVGQHLGLSIQDSFELYPGLYEDKWGIEDPKDFLRRLSELSRWPLVCLEIFAAGFWESKHQNTSIEKYCEVLV